MRLLTAVSGVRVPQQAPEKHPNSRVFFLCLKSGIRTPDTAFFRSVLRHDGRPFGARAATGGENVSAERSSQSTQPRAHCSPFGRGAWRLLRERRRCPLKSWGPFGGNDFWGNPQEGVIVFPGLGTLRIRECELKHPLLGKLPRAREYRPPPSLRAFLPHAE